MQATRDASLDAARRSFERAVSLDPTFAAALLRLSIATFDAAPAEARGTFQRAAQLRASLGEHDQVLFDAMEPYVQRQSSDFAEWERRLEHAVKGAPSDADFLYLLGNARAHRGDLPAALEVYQRATEVDPRFARARWATGETQAYLGQMSQARAALDQCLDESPGATNCLQAEAWIAEEEGRCEDVEATAKRWIATDGGAAGGYELLAKALFALGRPIDAVEAALAQGWARAPAAARASQETADRIALALLAGRFDEAESRARDLERAAADDPSLDAHAKPALVLVRLYEETDREPLAAKVASDFMKRREAYVAEPREEDFALAKDATPEMNAAIARATGRRNVVAELEPRRAAWLEEWRGLAPLYRHYLWIHGFAKTAESAAEAKSALEALADYQPLPVFRPLTFADGDLGRTYLLAGDAASALPALERAAASCVAIDFPIAAIRAQLFLGEAREATGDRAGACSAYAAVLKRWGTMTGRSRTAREAAGRARGLGCGG
jgi:serine/threonine-protein kinase